MGANKERIFTIKNSMIAHAVSPSITERIPTARTAANCTGFSTNFLRNFDLRKGFCRNCCIWRRVGSIIAIKRPPARGGLPATREPTAHRPERTHDIVPHPGNCQDKYKHKQTISEHFSQMGSQTGKKIPPATTDTLCRRFFQGIRHILLLFAVTSKSTVPQCAYMSIFMTLV